MNKKILILLICCLLMGCNQNKSVESLQFDEYHQIQERLINQTKFVMTSLFETTIIYNELDNEYRYDLVINNPKCEMNDIIAVCYVDEDSEAMFPTIGIFEDEEYHLKEDYINKEKNYYKGIMLSGITQIKGNAKLYISFTNNENKREELFIEVLNEN